MESNVPVLAKRVWSMVRVALYMLRKGISTKQKLIMSDFHVILKRRRKLAGKAIADLFSLHHHVDNNNNNNLHLDFSAPREYEFSCSNTPAYHNFFPKRHAHFFACAHAPPTLDDDDVDVASVNHAFRAALEFLENGNIGRDAVEASPALPEFGRTPVATRQLRVTDSPFPVQNGDEDRDHKVDKAAEEFINRFYKELRKQG